MGEACTHLDQIDLEVQPDSSEGCTECIEMGSGWVHLRMCMSCGHVACCDDSPNKHATKHYVESHHPIISSLQPGEDWLWCFEDKVMLAPAA